MGTETKRPRLSPDQIEYRRRVYEIAAEVVEETGADDVTEVDPAVVAARYREATGERNVGRARPARVGKILSDPARYAPHVDEIALERAWQFDWRVIENLSDLEWQVFVERLAADPDPWELDSVRRSYRPKASGESEWSLGDLVLEAEVDLRTARRRRYEEGPAVLQRRLGDAVSAARGPRLAVAR